MSFWETINPLVLMKKFNLNICARASHENNNSQTGSIKDDLTFMI